MKYSIKEKKAIAITLSIFSLTLIITGTIMNSKDKPVINTKYTLKNETKKIAEAQAKTNEIKVKDIEIEINNPISINVKDYLEDIDKISEDTLNALKLDTSMVNINEAGTYQYTITYKKKKYLGNIIVKEKELPNFNFTLKTIKIKIGESLSSNPRTFINEEISDEIYNNLTLDLSKVDVTRQQDYDYYITYKGVTYQGKVEVRAPGPTIITPNTNEEKEEETDNNTTIDNTTETDKDKQN